MPGRRALGIPRAMPQGRIRSALSYLAGITDRIRLGFVIDFIVLHAGNYHWPTFNIADASITIGALLLAFDLIFSHRSKPQDVPGTVSHR